MVRTRTCHVFSGETAGYIKILLMQFILILSAECTAGIKKKLEKAHPGDCYGDLLVDTEQSFQVYKDWLENFRSALGAEGLRRPLWFKRPLKSVREKFYLK